MAINSKKKGSAGERELAGKLGELLGVSLRRSQQYCGVAGDADVIGVDGLHIEVKRVEKLNLSKAINQAIADAKPDQVPIVAHRKNREQWLVTVCLQDLLAMADVLSKAAKK